MVAVDALAQYAELGSAINALKKENDWLVERNQSLLKQLIQAREHQENWEDLGESYEAFAEHGARLQQVIFHVLRDTGTYDLFDLAAAARDAGLDMRGAL